MVSITIVALPSVITLDLSTDSYNLYSLPKEVFTKYSFKISIAGELPPLSVSAVIWRTNSSNNMPVFLYFVCFIFIKKYIYL